MLVQATLPLSVGILVGDDHKCTCTNYPGYHCNIKNLGRIQDEACYEAVGRKVCALRPQV